MSIRDIDVLVRTNSLEMLGTDALPQRYITALNMMEIASRTSSGAFLRLKPEDVKAVEKEIREPL